MSYSKHKSEESVEDYLETILILSKRLPEVRSIDVANELSYSKPSVSVAMKNLRNRQYVVVSEEGHIHLTEEGKRLAEAVYERHTLLSDWLIRLGVNPEVAVSDACKMEHDISPESFEAIKKCILSFLERT
ncbi:MAG: metal-dependent transcriptional regulator [Eubacteriales bacterium]|nr:metal-dependent transcriptional regulator [Eubacteriales bacterium]